MHKNYNGQSINQRKENNDLCNNCEYSGLDNIDKQSDLRYKISYLVDIESVDKDIGSNFWL